MDKIRLIFEKKDRARFISHLDLLRCMQRAFKRARIPIWYSQGFNPRSYIMFPLALSLGISSCCEIMDIMVTEDVPFEEIQNRMNAELPEGLKISHVRLQEMKHTEIGYAEYCVQILATIPAEDLLKKFNDFMSLERIEIEKLTKKKISTKIDIKPGIQQIECRLESNNLQLILRLPAGTQENLNVNLVIEAFEKEMHLVLENICIQRTKILCLNGKLFL